MTAESFDEFSTPADGREMARDDTSGHPATATDTRAHCPTRHPVTFGDADQYAEGYRQRV